MANKSGDIEQPLDHSQSRRSFLRSIKQIAAGASLAGIGLGLLDPLNALAASQSSPDAPACFGCRIIEHGGFIPKGCGCPGDTNYQNRIETAYGSYPHCYWTYPFWSCCQCSNCCNSVC